MMWIIRLLCVLAHLVLTVAGILLGFPAVGWLAWRRAWVRGRSARGLDVWAWEYAIAWPWGNREDGVCGPFGHETSLSPAIPDRWATFVWSAWRNKVSNLRFAPLISFQVNPARVSGIGNNRNLYAPLPAAGRFFWSLAWQGPYAGLWVMCRGVLQLRLGWTIVPADADGLDAKDLRQLFCGFSFQLNKAAA